MSKGMFGEQRTQSFIKWTVTEKTDREAQGGSIMLWGCVAAKSLGVIQINSNKFLKKS